MRFSFVSSLVAYIGLGRLLIGWGMHALMMSTVQVFTCLYFKYLQVHAVECKLKITLVNLLNLLALLSTATPQVPTIEPVPEPVWYEGPEPVKASGQVYKHTHKHTHQHTFIHYII